MAEPRVAAALLPERRHHLAGVVGVVGVAVVVGVVVVGVVGRSAASVDVREHCGKGPRL